MNVLQVKMCTSYRDHLMVTTMSDTGSLTGEIMYVQYMPRTSDNQHHLSESKKLLIVEDVTLEVFCSL